MRWRGRRRDGSGKRPRVFVFSDNDYRGERWEIVRRSVRGLRNIKLAWAARDVEESARDARNVDARAFAREE